MSYDSTPEEITSLLDRLAGVGLVPAAEHGSGAVNHQIECRSDRFAVRLTGDRGQWHVDGGLPGGTQWYDAAIWRSCLTSSPPEGLGPLEEQVDYFIASLDALALAATRDDTWQCLHRQRERRARERLGLPPAD